MTHGELAGFAVWGFGGFKQVVEGDVPAPAAPLNKYGEKAREQAQKLGFKEVGRFSVNLDDFAAEGLRNEQREDGKRGD